MNVWKKAFALITAALMVAYILSYDAYALAGPTVIASEELTVYLTELLMGAGHSASELDGLGNDDLQNMLQNDIDSGSIDPSTFNTSSLSSGQTGGNIFSDAFSMMVSQAYENGGDLYDFIHPTKVDSGYTVVDGCGLVKITNSDGTYYIYYGDEPGQVYYNGNEISAYLHYSHYEFYKSNGELFITNNNESCINLAYKNLVDGEYVKRNDVSIFGSWAWREDGTEAETEDKEEYVLGEADGVPVTPDMVNADGTVTIGDRTYNPDEYVDPDALTDEALIELLKRILEAIDNTPVVDTSDNTLADDIAGDVAVELDAADLNNFTVPTGITSVFPFCLPFDFIRGLQLLSSQPVAPVFEVPFNIPSFGLYEGTENTVTLDMAKYSKYFEVARWVQVVLFSMALIFISRKLVQGVH